MVKFDCASALFHCFRQTRERDQKQGQMASEPLGRQYRVGTIFLGYKRRRVLVRGLGQQDPDFLLRLVSSQAVNE